MIHLIVAMAIFGSAPICSFDGYVFSCYYYSWQHCESAIRGGSQRCVTNPGIRGRSYDRP